MNGKMRTSAVMTVIVGLAFLMPFAFGQGPGRWMTGASMPSARSEVAVAAVAGKIYVVGGFGAGRQLEIYEPATNRWLRGAPAPRAVHHATAVGLNDKLYMIGGYAGGWSPVDFVYEYDPATDAWRKRASLPTPRGALTAVVLDGKIHVLSGVGAPRRQRLVAGS